MAAMQRVALILLLAPIAILGACASEDVNTEPDAAPVTVTETVETGGESTTNATEETTTEEKAEASAETAGQKNARRSGESYLEFSAFSRKGLIEQLKYEDYSTKDATYAVDAVGADWNAQAAESAKLYLEMSPFSRSGLIEQLEYEGFTQAQATYGVDKAGL